MTSLLEPAIEARLQEWAAREQQSADTLANSLLANSLLAEALRQQEVDREHAFKQALLTSGLVKRLAPARDPRTADRPLVDISGKPVSETLLEEGRKITLHWKCRLSILMTSIRNFALHLVSQQNGDNTLL